MSKSQLFSTENAEILANSFLEQAGITPETSLADLKQHSEAIFTQLTAPNGTISHETREALMASNIAVSNLMRRQTAPSHIAGATEEEFDNGLNNDILEKTKEITQLRQNHASEAHINQVSRELNSLQNVRALADSDGKAEFKPYFEPGSNDRERYERNQGNATYIPAPSEQEQLMAERTVMSEQD